MTMNTFTPLRESAAGLPLRWGGPDRMIHAVEGSREVQWTRCEKFDVPSDVQFAELSSRLLPTCEECLLLVTEEEMAPNIKEPQFRHRPPK